MHTCDHDCKHKNVKFCNKCQRPYCVDCNREWYEACTLTHWTYTYNPHWDVNPTTGNPLPQDPYKITCGHV